ncbi:MAG: hypothetical protein GXO59_05345 [Dictyoglomi bacterium]|nr:hypothetical protein [Dictyoglomota bacterium]
MEIKKIKYAYFLVYDDKTVPIEPEIIEEHERLEKKRVVIPSEAEGLYVKALTKGISPVRERLYISGAISKTVKVEGSPFLDIQFEDRYAGSLTLMVTEAGEIFIPSKLVKASLQIDMGSKLVLAGDLKKTEVKLRRTSSLVVRRPIVDSILSGDLASLVIDVPGEEFYTYSSVWNVKVYKIEFKVKEPGEGARIYSSRFHLSASDAVLPYYLCFTDTLGKVDISLMSFIGEKVEVYAGNGMEFQGVFASNVSPVNMIREHFTVLWHDIFPGELHFSGSAYTDEISRKGLLYAALARQPEKDYSILIDMLGFYGLRARMFIPFDMRISESVLSILESLKDIPEEEMPIGNYISSDGKTGISFSIVSFSFPITFAGTVLDPDDYVIIKMFGEDRIYKLMLPRERLITLMRGWNNMEKEV